jgi:ABC-type Fe3+ transport system permease subunit
MPSLEDPESERQEGDVSAGQARRKRLIRLGRPRSMYGWLLWLLVALTFFLLISYVLIPWWYRPVPADIPPATPNSNTRRT